MRSNSLKSLSFFLLALGLLIPSHSAHALTLTQKLSGRILLQVQASGEAWYVHPVELKRYYLGTPEIAFGVMRSTGLGISDKDIARIAVAESALPGNTSTAFARTLSGRILLQVQAHGEAWYVNPVDLKRYYLGRPADAFALMRKLGLGVTDADIAKIPVTAESAAKIKEIEVQHIIDRNANNNATAPTTIQTNPDQPLSD